MARPKKAPRDRFQITLPTPVGRALRKYARKHDVEISSVVSDAVCAYLRGLRGIPPVVMPVELPGINPGVKLS